jgi:galactose mutarotase-like enzyme
MVCQLILETWWDGFTVYRLENEFLQVTLMPLRGGEIQQIRSKKSDLKFLCEGRPDMPDFRQPGPDAPLAPAENAAFSNFYTMFPNAGPLQTYRGYQYEFHGDIRAVAWEAKIITDSEAKIVLELKARCKEIPFELKRTISLEKGATCLSFRDELSHIGPTGSEKLPFIYGFHPYFSHPLLDENSQFKVGGQVIFEGPSRQERVNRLYSIETGQVGEVEIFNPVLKAAFRLRFDPSFLKYTWLWFVSKPAEKVYLGSLLPCTNFISPGSPDGINAALANQTARWLEPGELFSTNWQIEAEVF